MEGQPSSNSSSQQATDSRTMLSQVTPLGSHPSPFPASSTAPFFSSRRDHEPAFAVATANFDKPNLRSSQLLQGLSRLEGAHGHVPGMGAFHPVHPQSGQRSSEMNGGNHMTSMANGSHSFTDQHRSIEDTSEDKRLPRRKRKASNHEFSVCTICGVTVRPVELPAHYEIEIDRLNKITRPGKSSRESSSHSKKALPSTSSAKRKRENEEEGLVNKDSRREEYMRVKRNRLERLNARLGRCRKGLKKPLEETPSSAALCPICHEVLTGSVEERNTHAEACLRKVNPSQEDVEEEVNVDGEDDDFEEYTWCGQTRVRATSMLDSRFREAGFEVGRKEAECDTELNVDDDDTAEYGPEQFTEVDIIPCPSDDSAEDKQRQALRDAVVGDERASPPGSAPDPWLPSTSHVPSDTKPHRTEGIASARSDTVVECLKARIQELQEQLDSAAAVRIKCLICMEPFSVPLVSIQCWHVHCQQCWLRTLGAKKLCPQCNMITSPGQLRRIYL
ncbi:E3 ubiquitin-protein ligase RNF220-like isoform X2 [Acanthaster planci]|uniref:E3 ubiquitin-protein ligase RNF220-like isoform X2 n=1 Tax=Acanthaster planci TaxID=133434 RepID=A0A8B7Y5G0_ACAPL|nr:E3 ubiquitin-protein ligase RNF220-like isoform X2 [Acanthaster planci]